MDSNFHYLAALGFVLRYCQWQQVEWKVHGRNVSLLRFLLMIISLSHLSWSAVGSQQHHGPRRQVQRDN